MEEPDDVPADHTVVCAAEQEEPGDCDCGLDEKEEAYDTWENDRANKLDEAFDATENVLGELSI